MVSHVDTDSNENQYCESYKVLIYAIVERAYNDIKNYHRIVLKDKKSKIPSDAQEDYSSSIMYFTNPYTTESGKEYPSYFKYQMSLAGNEGDSIIKKILSSVLTMEKEINAKLNKGGRN